MWGQGQVDVNKRGAVGRAAVQTLLFTDQRQRTPLTHTYSLFCVCVGPPTQLVKLQLQSFILATIFFLWLQKHNHPVLILQRMFLEKNTQKSPYFEEKKFFKVARCS
jgi:hypothetical protein